MTEKITLYKEVLELEPGSRVFFPLAKLLAGKEPDEAVNVLKKGLTRHPDHIEARIFLVELLAARGGDVELDAELEIVGSILRNYPSFWKIWSAHMAHDAAMHDAALAINFFGAGLSGKNITWAEVIAQGLNALLAERDTRPGVESGAGQNAEAVSPASPSPVRLSAHLAAHAATPVADPVPVMTATDTSGDDDEPEEEFSLRTKTMADLLAEQGDYAGAIDIYNELLAAATDAERPLLQARLQSLAEQAHQGTGGTAKKDATVASDVDGSKLVSLLESLASRFETRAR